MKTLLVILSILAFTTQVTVRLRADESRSAKDSKLAVKDVTADEAEKLISGTPGLIVLDVRTPEEYDHEHIKGAVNVNLFDADFEKLIAGLDQSKPVLLHCASGRRSSGAIKQMTGKVKFPQVYHMNEGFNAWKAAKKPFEGKPLPKEIK